MGIRSTVACAALVLAIAACGEQQTPETVAGPSLTRHDTPPNPAACDPSSLNSLITGYFQGNSANPIKTLKDAMVASPGNGTTARNNGFAILDSIGALSRRLTVDTDAGSALAQGVIKCMFDATTFTPSFPSDAIYNFAPALDAVAGGGFYTRGAGTGGAGPVQGAVPGDPDPNVLSGVDPPTGSTWSSILAGNTGSEGRVLIYGYPVTTTRWCTSGPRSRPRRVRSRRGGGDLRWSRRRRLDGPRVHHRRPGLHLGQPDLRVAPVAGHQGHRAGARGPWPRGSLARWSRRSGPELLQAAMAKSGTGGTATTFKSKFSKKPVTTIPLTFTIKPPAVIRLGQTVRPRCGPPPRWTA